MISRHRKKVKVDLKRTGEQVKILRASGGTKNNYGKITGETYSPVKDADGNDIKEYVTPDFNQGAEEETTQGGTFDVTNPTLFFAHDSVVEEDDRIVIYGKEYSVQNIIRHPTHMVTNAVSVDG